MKLTAEEKQLALTLGFDEKVLMLVNSEVQKPLKPLKVSPSVVSADILRANGLSVVLPEKYVWMWEPDYLELIHQMHSTLLPYGYTAFLTEAPHPRPCLAILKTLDQYEIIRVVETRGWDFDDKYWQPDELIAKLQIWEQLCDFNIIGAGYKNIKIEFKTLPQDLIGFADEINRLCWELNQVYDVECYSDEVLENRRLAEQVAQIIRETHKIYLWWD